MQRILALDVGEKRIGIAVSDPLGITAQGLETYARREIDQDVAYILKMAEGYKPVMLLFGLPRNMDGSYGFQSERVRAFANEILKLWDGPHDYCDERLTTCAAERTLLEADMSRQKRRKVIDKLAAVMILQGYLDAKCR